MELGSAKVSAGKNQAEYTASLKNKKMSKHTPRPHQAPSQAASPPKLPSQETGVLNILFRQTQYRPLCNKRAKQYTATTSSIILFDADTGSAVVGGVRLAARVPADAWNI